MDPCVTSTSTASVDRVRTRRFLVRTSIELTRPSRHPAATSCGAERRRRVLFSTSTNDGNNDVLRSSAPTASNDNDEEEDGSVSVSGVTLKIALDASGGAADLSAEKSERFTCGASLDMVHRLRACSDAVLVGKGTVIADNPSLLVRRGVHVEQQPLRVVIDPSLELLLTTGDDEADDDDDDGEQQYQLFSDGYPTVVYHCQHDVDDSLLDLDERCVTIVYLEHSTKAADDNNNSNNKQRLSPRAIVQDLRDRFGVEHLMVEGGPETARRFLKDGLVDRCILVRASTVHFAEPLPSGITDQVLSKSLARLGSLPSGDGVDEITCWSRPDLPWPTESINDWP